MGYDVGLTKSPPVYRLDPYDANYMLDEWHYLGAVRGIIAAYGHHQGCCVFTNCRSRVLESNLPDERPIELARMVGMPGHTWSMTSLMSQCMKEIRKLGYTYVVTYADPWNGNTGAVYRAGNWTPDGESGQDTVYMVDGVRVARRTMYNRHGTQSKPVLKQIYGDRLQFEPAPPKPRFIMRLR